MPPSIQIARSRISQASGAGNTNSPVGWIVAILLHAAIGAAALLSFSHQVEIAVDETPVVPVDLVTLGAKTNVMAMTKEPKAPPKEVPVPATPQEIPAPTPAPPPPKAVEATPPKPAEAAPAEDVPKPQAKPKPVQPDKQKTQDQQMAALLDKYSAPAAAPKKAKPGNRTMNGVGDMDALTADLNALLNGEVGKCFSPPAGAPHPETLNPVFQLFLNPDGSVARPPQLAADSQAEEATNPYMRAAVDSARRAIYLCAPFKLPPEHYSKWRDITFVFHGDAGTGEQ